MIHIKLFEAFNESKADDETNISFKKAKKRNKVSEAEDSDKISDEDQAYEDKLDKLFKKLVPSSGAAETIEGEIVRAMMRILYRYFNDGDYFFRGYGKETAKPSVDWLRTHTPAEVKKEFKEAFAEAQKNAPRPDSAAEFNEKLDGYLKGIREAIKVAVDYVESKNGKYTPLGEIPDSRMFTKRPRKPRRSSW